LKHAKFSAYKGSMMQVYALALWSPERNYRNGAIGNIWLAWFLLQICTKPLRNIKVLINCHFFV